MFTNNYDGEIPPFNESEDKLDATCVSIRVFLFLIMSLLIVPCFATGIRYYTFFNFQAYSEPCNATKLVSLSYLYSQNREKNRLNVLLERDTWKNEVGGTRIPEIEIARNRKKEIDDLLKVQIEYRQKCAGINIRNDRKNILEKTLFRAMWLFRTASILLLAFGCVLYKFRGIVIEYFKSTFIVCDLIAALFICAGLSMNDYNYVRNFDEKLIDFGECLFCELQN